MNRTIKIFVRLAILIGVAAGIITMMKTEKKELIKNLIICGFILGIAVFSTYYIYNKFLINYKHIDEHENQLCYS